MNYVPKGQNSDDEIVDSARTSLEKMKISYNSDLVASFEKTMGKTSKGMVGEQQFWFRF